jgi:hypothetical protein
MKIGVVVFCTLPLVATSQKKTPVLALLGTNKIEKPFLCGKSKNPSYKSCWPWKDIHLCQKCRQDSKVCYGACTNHGQIG